MIIALQQRKQLVIAEVTEEKKAIFFIDEEIPLHMKREQSMMKNNINFNNLVCGRYLRFASFVQWY